MSQNNILPVIAMKEPVMLPNIEQRIEVARVHSKNAIVQSKENYDREILLVFYNKPLDNNEVPTPEICYPIGVIARFDSELKLANANYRVKFSTFGRVKLDYIFLKDNCLYSEYHFLDEEYGDAEEEKNLVSKVTQEVMEKSAAILRTPKTVLDEINKNSGAARFSDVVASSLLVDGRQMYKYLAETKVNIRLKMILDDISGILSHKELDDKIEDAVRKSMEQSQKEYYLREKIKAIQNELGDIDNNVTDIEKLREKIENAGMPENVKNHVSRELHRYQSVPSASPESSMIRSYIDTMIDIPWKYETKDEEDIRKAKEKLDETHFGLDKVKDRILEYLSVKLYTKKNPQTILCFAGPPGVGKTTLAKSIAEALGRKFVKQSLGGIKDEAEIRGHRRTYIGSLPGRIMHGMAEAGSINPVFLLDEIDKVGSDYKGDPSAALLEVLDPEQNKYFSDNYVEEQYDLSKVMFICTANYTENIPAPLYDRMEIIELSSYTELEKFQIAKTHVIRKELKANGLEENKLEITDGAIMSLIKHYTREAGVRQVERLIGSIVRKSIRKILEEKLDKVVVDESNLKDYLGKEIFQNNSTENEDLVGVVTGLAYTQFGGDTLQIEVTTYKGSGQLVLTGKLGDVMKESARTAFSWVRSHAADYNIDEEIFSKVDTHIHVPEGAVPKDGPSAGVTMATAIASAFTKRKVHHEVGMTGEATLRGRVLPIGGLKEKSIAANRSGLKRILIPKENLRDLDDIPKEVKDALEIIPVSSLEEVLSYALV